MDRIPEFVCNGTEISPVKTYVSVSQFIKSKEEYIFLLNGQDTRV